MCRLSSQRGDGSRRHASSSQPWRSRSFDEEGREAANRRRGRATTTTTVEDEESRRHQRIRQEEQTTGMASGNSADGTAAEAETAAEDEAWQESAVASPPAFEFQHESWRRLSGASLHAHFDCFSGAAGDMMLAACLDAAACSADDDHGYPGGDRRGSASGDPDRSTDGDRLQLHVRDCLTRGMPQLAEEFDIRSRQVWRGRGSIGARHVKVASVYGHRPARVPAPAVAAADGEEGSALDHSHSHSRSHSHSHSHMHSDSGAQKENNEQQTEDHRHYHHDHDSTFGTGPIRNLPEIRSMLESEVAARWIPRWVRETAIEVFTHLAWAEAAVHCASSADEVHFHEVGAVDSIVDTVGTLLALHCLGIRSVSCGRLPLSRGHVKTVHGILPVPAPATLCLMIGMCTAPGPPGVTGELVTPTGAALLQVLTRKSSSSSSSSSSDNNNNSSSNRATWGECPPMKLLKLGTGAGTKNFEDHPNILRVLIGELLPPSAAS